jgi:hypothetical protein
MRVAGRPSRASGAERPTRGPLRRPARAVSATAGRTGGRAAARESWHHAWAAETRFDEILQNTFGEPLADHLTERVLPISTNPVTEDRHYPASTRPAPPRLVEQRVARAGRQVAARLVMPREVASGDCDAAPQAAGAGGGRLGEHRVLVGHEIDDAVGDHDIDRLVLGRSRRPGDTARLVT